MINKLKMIANSSFEIFSKLCIFENHYRPGQGLMWVIKMVIQLIIPYPYIEYFTFGVANPLHWVHIYLPKIENYFIFHKISKIWKLQDLFPI